MSRRLRLAACAHPRADRPLVLALAEDLVADGASPGREAAALLRTGLEARIGLTGTPWREALSRIELPLAGLFVAAMTLGTVHGGLGWTSAAGVLASAVALLGFATGRRTLALSGAALIVAVCALDGSRDQFGDGSRWMALAVDVLPALLPAALLLLAAATEPRRHGFRATAWTLAAVAALTLLALAIESNTTPGTTVLAAALALATFTLARDRTAGPLVLAAAAPVACWSLAATAPAPAFPVLAASSALLVAVLVRRASASRR
jgi:hypothetical protein